MRRIAVIAAVVLTVCALGIPARGSTSQGGRVLLSAASPAVAKAEFNNARRNGVTGFVFRLGAGADNKPYTLTTLLGATGIEDFDAWFFEDLEGSASGPGKMCGTVDSRQTGAVESGRICPNDDVAEWAVITLFTGANGIFVFNY